MSELVDRSVASLRTHHDRLEKLIGDHSADDLSGQSGASEWTIAQALSHLGSGAEISLNTFTSAVTGVPAPSIDNQAVWDRWNAWSPAEQAAGFLEHDERLVALLESITPEQRDTVTVELGFMPEPVPLATAIGMRLNEAAAHGWDVHVGFDPDAELDSVAAPLLFEHFAGGLGFLLGFAGKADRLEQPARISLPGFGLLVEDSVRVTVGASESPTATFTGPLEAAVRLLSGRLKPEHTAEGIEVTGNVSLDDLRQVFPGY